MTYLIIALLVVVLIALLVDRDRHYIPRATHDERGRWIADVMAQRDRHLDTIDELRTELARMRRDGFIPFKQAIVREAPDEEAAAVGRAEQQLIQRRDDEAFIRRATAKIMADNPGMSSKAALEEAMRLRRAVTDEDTPT